MNAKHFRIVHRLSRRLRLIVPSLAKQAERCYIVEILLRKHPAITGVRAVPEIGSLLVYYDPAALPEARLLATLDAVIGNIAAAPLRPAAAQAPAEADTAPLRECNVAIEGMTCASCALLIELSLARDPRIEHAGVNFAAGTATVKGRMTRDQLFAAVHRLGYEARPMDTLTQRRLLVEREKARIDLARKKFWQGILLAAPVVTSGMLMHRDPILRLLEFALSTAAMAGPAGDIFRKAWLLAKERQANMDTLIAIGAGAAWSYSLPGVFRPEHHVYFESAAGILGFVLAGRYLEERAKGRASEAIRKLIELQPATAIRITDSGEEEVAVETLALGDRLRVRPGDKVPTDGIVTEGSSAIDESLLTGEALPVAKNPGDPVAGGCLNGTGAFIMRVTAIGGDTVLAGIVRMVDHAQSAKLPVQKLVDRISARFVPAVGSIAAATFGGWLLAGHPASRALTHAVAVLLIACPCALGLATPTAIMVGTGQAARRGIYIRNGEALETAAKLTTLVFDKTGTITEGRPTVTDFATAIGDERELLARVAAVESHSEHFLARAIVAYCRESGASAHPSPVAVDTSRVVSDFAAQPGRGVTAHCADSKILIGNAALLEEAGIACTDWQARADLWAAQGKTPVFVAQGDRCVALFAISDRARPGAREAIALLHRLGLRTVMATGDVELAARHVAREVGIDDVVARATPADKLALIHHWQRQGAKVGMIGDGINDAPALAAADVGFAIGGGADIAVEAADITLIGADISRVAASIELSRRSMRTIRQNLFWALGYNVVAIPIAAAGRLNPMIAAAAMGMSSLSVLSNSLRLQADRR